MRISSPLGDPDGWEALEEGSFSYNMAMETTEEPMHFFRMDNFRQAEYSYLQAASKGNILAYCSLGYLYSYDRCEGKYYGTWENAQANIDYPGTFPREKFAFDYFEKAATEGLVEAAYKLGDMYKKGMGCAQSAAKAFEWYEQASQWVQNSPNEPDYVLGSIALRLGEAYENGLGCEQSFVHALEWYEKAVTGLDNAVRDGDWFYNKALAGAKDGVARCKQELSL